MASALFGVTPVTTMVEVDHETFFVRFGPWSLKTPLANVAGCDETGPFSFVKAGGPARMSLADKGISFATNGDRGLCVQFREPVAAIAPLGCLRHPAVTVTVARTAELRRLLEGTTGQDDEQIDAESEGVAAESPWAHLARWARYPPAMLQASWNHLWIFRSVSRTHEVRTGPPPSLPATPGVVEVQAIATGVGPTIERTYRAHITESTLSPEELMAHIAEDLNRISTTSVSDFVDQRTTDEPAGVGSEYLIHLPGPWNAPVRVIERTPTSIQLTTLDGHMEAGQIHLGTRRGDNAEAGTDVIFEIRSVARSGDQLFHLLYHRLGLVT